MTISKVTALKTFFSTKTKPITNTELLALRREDKESFDELAKLCAVELGEELDTLSK